MNTQTIGMLSVENQTFYDRTLLERCLPNLTFYDDALKKKIPKGKGTSIEFRKFNSLAAATTPLTEGVTPNGNGLNITAIIKSLSQYGDFVRLSDVLELQAKDPVIAETSELLGEQAGITLNKIIAEVISSGTSVRYAGNKTATVDLTSADKLTGDLVKKTVRDLAKCNIKRFEDGYYHATISAEQAYDLMSDTATGGWIDVAKYANTRTLLKGEIGEYGGVRFKVSSETPKGEGAISTYKKTADEEIVTGKNYYTKAGNVYTKVASPVLQNIGDYYEADTFVEVHKALIYGKDSYGVPEIGSNAGKPKIIVKPKGSGGTEDPLDQRSSVGWKSMFTAVRLNELGIVRVETGISA